jgi:hypothetical protein
VRSIRRMSIRSVPTPRIIVLRLARCPGGTAAGRGVAAGAEAMPVGRCAR